MNSLLGIAAVITAITGLTVALGTIILQLRVIHKTVNSNWTEAQERIDALHKKIAHLVKEATEAGS